MGNYIAEKQYCFLFKRETKCVDIGHFTHVLLDHTNQAIVKKHSLCSLGDEELKLKRTRLKIQKIQAKK